MLVYLHKSDIKFKNKLLKLFLVVGCLYINTNSRDHSDDFRLFLSREGAGWNWRTSIELNLVSQ